MKNTIQLLCGIVAIGSLNCGGEPLDASNSATGSESAMVESVVSTRNADGTYTKKPLLQTRAEYEAMLARRDEVVRMHREGLAAAPSEIGPGDCSEWDTLMIWSGRNRTGQLCCVAGPDWDYVYNMCNFTYARRISSTERAGYYSNDNESHYGGFTTWQEKNTEYNDLDIMAQSY